MWMSIRTLTAFMKKFEYLNKKWSFDLVKGIDITNYIRVSVHLDTNSKLHTYFSNTVANFFHIISNVEMGLEWQVCSGVLLLIW